MASGKKHYGKGLRVCEPSLSLSVKQLDKHNGGKTADALIDFANALSELFTPICFEAKLEREHSAFRRLNSFS